MTAVDVACAQQRTIRFVVPAYDEAASIGDLIDRISQVAAEAAWSWELIVVDDGSTDGTGEIARARADAGLPVSVLRSECNQGLGCTIRTGLRAACDAASATDVIVTLDADLTQDPAYVPAMLAKLDEGHDVVIASRYRRGSAVEGLSSARRMLSFGASALILLVRPIRGVRDYSCGFRAYRASALQQGFKRYGDELVSESGFGCMVEIAERLRESASFAEIPFVLHYGEKRRPSAIRIGPTIRAYFRVIANVARDQRQTVQVATLTIAFSAIAIGSVGQLLLRQGARVLEGETLAQTLTDAVSPPFVSAVGITPSGLVLAGLGLYAVSSVMWLVVLSRLDVSVAYPLGASGYVLVVLLAAAAGEAVPPARWAGVALIILGVLFVGWLGVAPVVGKRT